ncbi:hypothetical protein ACSBR2_007000 [Camellia fascicularis]
MSEDEKLLKEAKKLPCEDHLMHKNWKVRNDANIDLAAVCDSISDPNSISLLVLVKLKRNGAREKEGRRSGSTGMEEYRTILTDVFGESSDSEGDELQKHQIQFESPNNGVQSESIFGENPSWERVAEINGLWLCRDFLSLDQQSSLLSTIERTGLANSWCW